MRWKAKECILDIYVPCSLHMCSCTTWSQQNSWAALCLTGRSKYPVNWSAWVSRNGQDFAFACTIYVRALSSGFCKLAREVQNDEKSFFWVQRPYPESEAPTMLHKRPTSYVHVVSYIKNLSQSVKTACLQRLSILFSMYSKVTCSP